MDACSGRSADAGTGCDGVAVGADAVVARGIDAELDAEPSSWPVPPGEKTDPAGSQAPVTPTPPDAPGDVPAVVVGRLRVPGPLLTTRGAALTGIPGTRPGPRWRSCPNCPTRNGHPGCHAGDARVHLRGRVVCGTRNVICTKRFRTFPANRTATTWKRAPSPRRAVSTTGTSSRTSPRRIRGR